MPTLVEVFDLKSRHLIAQSTGGVASSLDVYR